MFRDAHIGDKILKQSKEITFYKIQDWGTFVGKGRTVFVRGHVEEGLAGFYFLLWVAVTRVFTF